MTPDDVVARAKELVGKEVDVTIRGVVVQYASDSPGHHFGVERSGSGCFAVSLTRYGESAADLVSIEPAPLRIEDGCIYTDDDGQVWVPLRPADDDAATWLMHEVRTGLTNVPQGTIRGLRLAKVVPA